MATVMYQTEKQERARSRPLLSTTSVPVMMGNPMWNSQHEYYVDSFHPRTRYLDHHTNQPTSHPMYHPMSHQMSHPMSHPMSHNMIKTKAHETPHLIEHYPYIQYQLEHLTHPGMYSHHTPYHETQLMNLPSYHGHHGHHHGMLSSAHHLSPFRTIPLY